MEESEKLWRAEQERLEEAHLTIAKQKRRFLWVTPALAILSAVAGSFYLYQVYKTSSFETVAAKAVEQASILKDVQSGTGADTQAAKLAYDGLISDASQAGIAEPVRVYFHIADNSARPAARAAELKLEAMMIAGRPIVVPGIQRVKASPKKSALRCFNVDDCNLGKELLQMVRQSFSDNSIVLNTQSGLYRNANPGQFELWLAGPAAAPPPPSQIPDRVRKIMHEHLGVPVAKLTDEANLIDDIGADSLDLIELVMALEEEFGILIPDQAMPKLQRVSDFIAYVEKNVPATR